MSLQEGIVALWFVVSILSYLLFSRAAELRARRLGSTPSMWMRQLPLYSESVLDSALQKLGIKANARLWGVLLVLNCVAATTAFLKVVVPGMEREAAKTRVTH